MAGEHTAAKKHHIIYWVRHGETIGNTERIYRDPLTAVLTERGRHQAKLVGETLSDVVFTQAYSSHLPRATETAKIVLEKSKHSCSLTLNTDPRIREREHGDWEGKSYDEASAIRGKGIDENSPLFPYAKFTVGGTENPLDIIDRMESFILDLLNTLDKSSNNETVLVIGHAFVTDVYMTYLGQQNKQPTGKYKLVNYIDDLAMSLQNCGYHTISLSSEYPNNQQDPVTCMEFIEIHRDGHLSPTGFASVRD